MLNIIVNKLKSTSPRNLLVLSVISSEIFTGIIVAIMSIIFHGKITADYLITGAIAAFLVSFIVVYIITQILDQLRESEKLLRESHERRESFFNILEKSLNEIYIFDADTLRFKYVNAGAVRNLGYTSEKLKEMTPLDLKPEFDEASFRNLIAPLLSREKNKQVFETVHRRADGSLYPVEVHLQLMEHGDERVFLAVILDTTMRKKTEEQILKLSYAIEQSPSTVVITDTNGNIEYVNTKFTELTGYTYEEAIGANPRILKSGMTPPEEYKRLWDTITSGDEWRGEFCNRKKNGDLYWELASISPIRNPRGVITHFVAVKEDITERKRMEEFIKSILESVGEGFIVIDNEYRIVSANKAYCEQVKMPPEDIVGRCCYEISHHRDKPCHEAGETCAPRHTFETGEPYMALHTHCDRNENPVYVETRSYPIMDVLGRVISVIEIVDDITEKKRLEEQLRQSQKMEAIGQLAGGIAHDFNNILTAIIGYGSLLKTNVEKDNLLMPYVGHILKSAERAANLTRQILAFSRKQIIRPKPVDINEIIRNTEKLLLRVIGEDIELKTILTDKDLTVMADSTQIDQVLLNLCTNARDAMPEGGILTVSTESVVMDRKFVKEHGYGKPDKYACISATDTGIGLDERTRERIFEPFFTTKEVGKGTGLGLSVAYGIIAQHGGYIDVHSELGKGTTFKIYIPLIKGKAITPAVEIAPVINSGTETILLAEDDEIVRKLIKDILEGGGYTVIEAVDGEDAMEKFMQNKDKTQIILFDVVMPKKSGKDAYDEIKKTMPDIKAIFMSGYTADIIHKKGAFEERTPFLFKPVSPDEILRMVREVLDK